MLIKRCLRDHETVRRVNGAGRGVETRRCSCDPRCMYPTITDLPLSFFAGGVRIVQLLWFFSSPIKSPGGLARVDIDELLCVYGGSFKREVIAMLTADIKNVKRRALPFPLLLHPLPHNPPLMARDASVCLALSYVLPVLADFHPRRNRCGKRRNGKPLPKANIDKTISRNSHSVITEIGAKSKAKRSTRVVALVRRAALCSSRPQFQEKI